jgi:uncharacterized membrane protein YhaH (DUF805 family)
LGGIGAPIPSRPLNHIRLECIKTDCGSKARIGEGVMLNNILGFGGRMGRLEYFLACMGLGFFVILLMLALIFGFKPHGESYASAGVPTGLTLALLIVVLPIYLWFALAFQAKRLRDMGWNPLYVMPAYFWLLLVDRFVSFTMPTLAVGHHAGSGTLIGALFNLAMCLCLLFWPSKPTGDGDWYSNTSYRDDAPDPEPVTNYAPAFTPRPAAPRTPPPAPGFTPAPSGFGRRGV